MSTVQIIDVKQLPDNATYQKFRVNPSDKCLIANSSHCGIWWTRTPSPDERLGLIGHFFAEDEQDSQALLEAACGYLRDKGCRKAIGPMDGNTWKSYRLVTYSDGSGPFLMEPQNPQEWPGYWLRSGFVPLHEYISTMVTDLGIPDHRVEKAGNRLRSAGIRWRRIQIENFSKELRKVYRLSVEAFKENVLYTPIDEESFLKQYLPFAGQINTDYVLISEDKQGQCCGFIFAVPDLLQAQRGENIDRLIIKTLAVSSGRKYAGLGAVLVDEVHRKAHRNGLHHAIHALMYGKNNSTNIGKNGSVMRRYTLFQRNLT